MPAWPRSSLEIVRRLEKSSTIVMVTRGRFEVVTDEVARVSCKGLPFFSQLKLTGVSPRTSPQSTRVRVPAGSTVEDREEEIVPKLKGANTGGTER